MNKQWVGAEGFALLQAVIILGATATTLLAITTMLARQNQVIAGSGVVLSRNNLVANIRAAASQPATMIKSGAFVGNSELAQCLNASGTCTQGVAYPFTLVDTTSSILSTRSDQASVRYDSHGNVCTSAWPDSLCPITASSSFTISCPGGGNCTAYIQSELAAGRWPNATITTLYTVSQNPNAILPNGRLRTINDNTTIAWKLVTQLIPAPSSLCGSLSCLDINICPAGGILDTATCTCACYLVFPVDTGGGNNGGTSGGDGDGGSD